MLNVACKVPYKQSFIANFFEYIYKNDFPTVFQLQILFIANIIPSQHAESNNFGRKDEKKGSVSVVMAGALENTKLLQF